jgi:glycosyltransferase involved in cell wall biosynthesis
VKNNIVLQFICYNPRIYSGFDNFEIKLTLKLHENSLQNIFIYADELNVVKLKSDILESGGMINIISTKNKWITFKDVFGLFMKYKPRIVHSHFENYIHLIVALLSVVFRVSYYFSFWSEISSLSTKEYKKKKGFIKFFLLRTYYKLLIFISKRALVGSEGSGSKSNKIQTFYLGTEIYLNKKTNEFLKHHFNVPNDYIVISNISAIEYIKGIHTLIDALILLKNKYGFCTFICYHVGTIRTVTPETTLFYKQLIGKIRKNGLETNFIWLEFLEDVTDILKISDIYVHPSLQEGLGSANLEAATQSLPIIGTNIGGIPEIIHQGINGFLFPCGSAEELAGYLNLLINDKKLRIRMGGESYRIVNETFNFEKQIQILVDLYLSGITERFIRREL